MIMKKYLWIFLFLFAIGGCERMEDTYSDYAGDGTIRYLGKCTDVAVSPGWKRLIVKWTNHIDPVIDKIKVSWTLDGVTRDTLLDRDVSECNISNLEDGNYEISVSNIDKEKNSSLPVSKSGRPYTSTHEAVLSFTRLVAKHYFVKDRLVIFFSMWQDNIESAVLNYYTSDGEQKSLELTSSLLRKEYYLLEDKIDPAKPVSLDRKGRIPGCDDLIVFDPYVLSHSKLYTSDFKQLIKTKYGLTEITDDFANSLKELEIDYSFASFEDILNLPNLKKLILGKNRFLEENHLDDYNADRTRTNESNSELYDVKRSLFALDVVNEVYGLTVERYNQHFLPDKILKEELPYLIPHDNPQAPEVDCLDADGWELSCSEKDTYPYNSHLENLFDGNLSNWWKPQSSSKLRTYEITVDMKEVKEIIGMRVVQKDFESEDFESAHLLPGQIRIQISTDKKVWKDATYVEANTIGATAGEITMIHLSSPKTARYVKFIVNDQVYGDSYSVILADIGIF